MACLEREDLLDRKDPKEVGEALDHLDLRVRRANKEKEESRASLVRLAHLVLPAAKVIQALLVHLEKRVQLA